MRLYSFFYISSLTTADPFFQQCSRRSLPLILSWNKKKPCSMSLFWDNYLLPDKMKVNKYHPGIIWALKRDILKESVPACFWKTVSCSEATEDMINSLHPHSLKLKIKYVYLICNKLWKMNLILENKYILTFLVILATLTSWSLFAVMVSIKLLGNLKQAQAENTARGRNVSLEPSHVFFGELVRIVPHLRTGFSVSVS